MSSSLDLQRSGWYPVLASKFLPIGTVEQTSLHEQDLALWRSADGAVHAWENRCPHRSVRLSIGVVREDQLVCRYHGWSFDGDGRCTCIPANPELAPPSAACVRTFAAIERHGLVWASLAPDDPEPPVLDSELVYARSFSLAIDASTVFQMARDDGMVVPGSCMVPSSGDEQTLGACTLLLQPETPMHCTVHLLCLPEHRQQAVAWFKSVRSQWLVTAREPSVKEVINA